MIAFIDDRRGGCGVEPVRKAPPPPTLPRLADRVNRRFRAPRPNVLRVADPTCAAAWRGFVHAAFVLDALEPALHGRRPSTASSAMAEGSQHARVRCTERLAGPGIGPSVGNVGGSCDNALAETAIGLFKAEAIRRRGPWRSLEAVEFAALERADRPNTRRRPEPIGNVPPAEAEARHRYAQAETPALAA